MGIRQTIQGMRDNWGAEGPRPLGLSRAAVAEIRRRVDEAKGEQVFFVLTQASPVGFNVGVGFEERTGDEALRPEFEVPVRVADTDWDRLAGYTIDFQDDHFVTMTDVRVHVKETPNPEARKFLVNRPLVTEGSATFTRPAAEDAPLLVRLLFEVPEVRSLFVIRDFVSVTREPEAVWDTFQTRVGQRIQAYFAHGGAPLVPPPREASTLDGVEGRIVQLLEDVIRPAVQRDGGDIAFAGYEDGTVQLYMLGSCSGCPSSMATLKMGVENLLRDAIPEVQEVVAID